MQKTVTYGATMYSIPEVVDMSVDSLVSGVDVLCTDSIPSGDLRQLLEVKLGEFVCSANICALLLDRVLTALMLIVTGCDQQLTVHGQKAGCRSTGGSLSLAISSPFEVDQGAFDAFGLRIPVRPFPVLEVLSNISNFQMLKSTDENTPLPVATIDTGLAALRRAFRFSTQDADVVPLLDESFVSLLSEGEVNRKCSWSIGTAQYHALLDLFGGSTEVSKVLTRHRLTSVHSDGVNSGNNPIKSFQIGQYSISDSNTAQRKLSLADLCSALSANPSVSYVLQLQSILQKIKEEGNEQDTELLTKVKLAEMALEKVRYAIAMKIKAKRLAEEMGEVEQAMEALSKALSPTHSKLKVKSKKADEEEDDEDENENEDEDEDEEESDEEEDDELEGDDGNSKGTFDKSTLLPAHLKVDLLLLRYANKNLKLKLLLTSFNFNDQYTVELNMPSQ